MLPMSFFYTYESNFIQILIQISDFSNLDTTFYDDNSAQLIYKLNIDISRSKK